MDSEADLSMFSMFGRTGAPTKMGPPHEDQKKFGNVPTYFHVVNDVSVQKTMSVCVIFNNIPSASGGSAPGTHWGTSVLQTPWLPPSKNSRGRPWGPHIFSEQGPVLSKSGPEWTALINGELRAVMFVYGC